MASVAPVRGTQSFVGVMAEVFRRPSLTGLEVLWRWVFWVAVLGRPGRLLFDDIMQAVNAFQARGFPGLGEVLTLLFWKLKFFVATHAGWLLAAVALWVLMSTAGRQTLLRRMDRSLRAPFGPSAILSAARWLGWALAVGLWCACMIVALGHFVAGPRASGVEAEWIPFCAVAIAGTLVLFVLWLGLSWVFSLMSIYAAQGETLGKCWKRAVQGGAVRGKVAEINLVMGIVKIALVVLAMVFSACPLPFETVETQDFLVMWTAGVLLVYFVASDYFHVVRLLAFVRMTEVLPVLPGGAAAQRSEAAS